jgi:2-methylisocitrate lyase-like PEP mutase family enzyme
MKKQTTQNDRVLAYMRSHKGITSLDAYRDLGCTRLSARIADLKRMGIAIGKVMVDRENRYGETVKVAQYFEVG